MSRPASEEAVEAVALRRMPMGEARSPMLWGRLKNAARSDLEAALPALRAQLFEEFKEQMVGDAAVETVAIRWHKREFDPKRMSLREFEAFLTKHGRSSEGFRAQARGDLEAALATAFDGATPTQPSLSDVREWLKKHLADLDADHPYNRTVSAALRRNMLRELLAYIEGGKDGE